MSTQFSTLLKIALPTQGELSGSWGDVVNNNITSMVEEAIAGLKTINTWSGNSATLSTANGTTAESRAAMLLLTDSTSDLSGAANLICPALSKVYIVKNGTGQTVTVKTASGSGIAVSNGNTSLLFCDGTNVVEAVTGITGNLDVGGNLTVGGNATVTGTTTFNGGTLTLGDSAADNVVFGADVNSSIIPNTDSTFDLGSASQEWRDIYIDGTAYIDAVNLDGTAITATAAEINLIDGGATVGTTAIADGDGLIINDAGTMRVSTVQTLAAYLDDEITAMPNLVTTAATTVGALDSGSITSGFGTIDTGASAITTTGLISGGSLDIDDVVINGSNIGHTDDTDLITVADGIVTVAGEISVTTLDIGGTNVTASAADINLIDGITNGTVIASKAIVTDSNKDISGGRNITVTGDVTVGGDIDLEGSIDVNGTLEADVITLAGTALSSVIAGTTVANATLAATTTVTDSTANTNFPVVFHNESNGLLDDTGALRYNPSTGELLVPKLTVAGTTTTVDTVTMNAENAIVFEGATADANETTLTIVDPTADRTINLPNQSGTIPVLAAASNTAVTSTPEELNILDGATVVVGEINALDLGATAVGTAIASKAVILDSDKDYTGIRNLTTTGVITVGSQLIMPDVTSAKILVADGTSFQEVAISGDATIANTGAVTIADNAISLAKLAGIARGKLIVGDSSGDPAVIGPGTNTQVLTSDGTDIAFADIPGASSLAADNLTAGDAAVLLTTSSGNITIDAAANDSDIIFKGTDGSADTTYLTIDGSEAGEAIFNAGLVIADAGTIGSASDKDAIAIASNGVVTFTQAPVFPDGSIAGADINIDGTTDIGAALADADEFLVDDGGGGTNRRCDMSRVKTYVADVTLTTAAQTNITSLGTLTALTVDDITINGSTISDGGDLTLDVAGDIILDADGKDYLFKDAGTLIATMSSDNTDFTIRSEVSDRDLKFEGNDDGATVVALTLDMSDAGSATFSHNVKLPDNGVLALGAGSDLSLSSNGTNGTIAAPNGDLTIDVQGELIIDTDSQSEGNGILLKDGGAGYGNIFRTNNDLIVMSTASNEDLIFKGNDGGSTITALTLDMSAAGAATFNNDVTAFSDRRLKTDISNIENGLDKVMKMQGVHYKRNDVEDAKEQIGVIAQDMEAIIPEVVLTADDEMQTKSVDYGKLTSVLIEAIKELKAEINELKGV